MNLINCRADHLFAVALAFVAGLYFGVVDDYSFGPSEDESHLDQDDTLVFDVEVAVFFGEVELDVCHWVFEILSMVGQVYTIFITTYALIHSLCFFRTALVYYGIDFFPKRIIKTRYCKIWVCGV